MIQKPVLVYFNFPWHFIADLGVAVFKQQNVNNWIKHETADQEIVHELDCVKYGINGDFGFLSHCLDQLL